MVQLCYTVKSKMKLVGCKVINEVEDKPGIIEVFLYLYYN